MERCGSAYRLPSQACTPYQGQTASAQTPGRYVVTEVREGTNLMDMSMKMVAATELFKGQNFCLMYGYFEWFSNYEFMKGVGGYLKWLGFSMCWLVTDLPGPWAGGWNRWGGWWSHIASLERLGRCLCPGTCGPSLNNWRKYCRHRFFFGQYVFFVRKFTRILYVYIYIYIYFFLLILVPRTVFCNFDTRKLRRYAVLIVSFYLE